ncbi:TetR/AcrR family transcriptional regulator [Mesorhizobium mediterraneum]|uniref:TetR family transcriptional regulator n=1 Tax=Mesorhizobium mediterraneum TaxID=43617 RepID=A0AB36R1I6_9HYPH|nr:MULTISPECIES: TetR/AcrR family transcriptional regulator [Mesorhizobium]PAP98435.1 TetR family transcriptional regulator [Mesorhizobium mediterraneum]RUU46139.1 TetR/AcrR family transcriptional regulator [Mesorhizobium sp. M6A.T.Ce.TU.002.03.1.1]RWN43454.1 MAG: TetR/AcrR family transcriptional regulator [Mesorhizobium sp.]RWP03757.1 MAG: TetR/AcrR family transcriptional regulator [Mesorhizobium sp.]RWQ67641.1 MAG: TetR/AcrR family transcriptional regulator [Mesorhizobium sp.]
MRYEKGRKDASRQRIMDVATERFRSDGIAASGIAGIMGEAGLTNGAFYPHFPSKAALVRESVAAALEVQATQIQELLAAGGLSMAIDTYLSAEHRDNPGKGCASAALLPEIAREPADTRQVYAEHLLKLVRQVAAELTPDARDPEDVAFGVFATLIGTLELSRAVNGTELSDRILEAGSVAAKALLQPRENDKPQERKPS